MDIFDVRRRGKCGELPDFRPHRDLDAVDPTTRRRRESATNRRLPSNPTEPDMPSPGLPMVRAAPTGCRCRDPTCRRPARAYGRRSELNGNLHSVSLPPPQSE